MQLKYKILVKPTIETGLIVTGRNELAVDTVYYALMDYDPSTIENLKFLDQKGIRPISLTKTELVNENLLEERWKTFMTPNTDIKNISSKIHAYVGTKCKECNIKYAECLRMFKADLNGSGINLEWENLEEKSIIVEKSVKLINEELENLNKKVTIICGDYGE